MKNDVKVLFNNIDFKELKKEYEAHSSRCKKISQEVSKWGKTHQKETQNPVTGPLVDFSLH
ncbi:MAG: hypothetical protein ACLU45_02065 [Dialister invisus]|uniref:hypothetical protein n=1 Tax=Dialister invisus TaxID=218538 RepID=UPI00399BBB94